MKNISNKILYSIYFIIGVILFITPIIFYPGTFSYFVTTKTFLFIFLTEIITLLYLWLLFLDYEYKPKKSYILYIFFLFILVNILSGILGESPSFSFWSGSIRLDGILTLIHIFLFFIVMSSVVRSRKILNIFIYISVISSFFVSLFSYFNSIGLNLFNSIKYIDNDSYVAVYLLFNLFLILYLILETKIKKIKYLFIFLFIFILFNPVFFNFNILHGLFSVHDLINKPITFIGTARGASIAIILGFIATFLLIFIKNKNKKISLFFKVSIIAYFVSLFIIIVMLFIPGTVVSNKFHNEAGGFRYIYWHQATEGFKEHPILGWGPGNFRIINAKYFNPVIYKNTLNAPETSSDKAHSIIFDNLISLGLLGSLVYLLLLFSIFITIWRSNNISHNTKSIFTGLLLSYLIQNLIFFDILTSWLMFVFLLSIILILNGEFSNLDKINFKENNKNFNKLNYIIPIALLIFGTLSIRYFAFLPIKKATNDFKFFSYSPLLRLGLYKDRVSLSTYGDIEDKEIYIAPIVDQYLSNLDFIKKQNDVIPYVKDINGLIQEISYPYGFGSESFSASNLIYKLFEIRYKLTNDNIFTLSRMKIYAQREIFLSTKNPIGYLDYANTFSYEKDYKNALIYLEKAYELCPYNKEVNIAIINATAKIGDKKLLKEKIERAKINLPTFNFNVNF